MQAKPNMQYPTKVGVLSPRTRCTVGYTGKKMSILIHSTQTIEQIKHIGIKKPAIPSNTAWALLINETRSFQILRKTVLTRYKNTALKRF